MILPWENSWRRSFQLKKGRKRPESSMTQTEIQLSFTRSNSFKIWSSDDQVFAAFSIKLILPVESVFPQRKVHSSFESIHWCPLPATSIFIFPFLPSPRCRNHSNPISSCPSHCFWDSCRLWNRNRQEHLFDLSIVPSSFPALSPSGLLSPFFSPNSEHIWKRREDDETIEWANH